MRAATSDIPSIELVPTPNSSMSSRDLYSADTTPALVVAAAVVLVVVVHTHTNTHTCTHSNTDTDTDTSTNTNTNTDIYLGVQCLSM